MNKVERAYYNHIKAKILPILEGYIGDKLSPAAILEINDEIIIQLRDDYIPIEWDVVVADDYSELEDKINKLDAAKKASWAEARAVILD